MDHRGVRLNRSIRFCPEFIALFCVLFLPGCVTISSGPDRALLAGTPPANVYAEVQADIVSIGRTYTKEVRNELITEWMYRIDLAYSDYFERLLKERQLGSAALDAGLLGLTAATTITPGAAAKTTLAAVSTAFAGAKTDIDQDIYMSSTLQILLNSMEAQRLAVRNRLDANMAKGVGDYTVWRALTDLDDYYRSGTLAGALQELASSTGSNAQNQKNLQNGTTTSGAPVNKSNVPQSGTTGQTSLGASVRALSVP